MKFLPIFLFLLSQALQAQTMEDARRNLAALCSPDFHGRGYVQEGERKAAEYIAAEYKAIGLKPLAAAGYFQPFTITANTLPGKMKVCLDKTKLMAGKDYLVHPDAPTVKGSYKTVILNKATMSDVNAMVKFLMDAKGKMVVIDLAEFDKKKKEDKDMLGEVEDMLKYSKETTIAGVVEIADDKLVWFPSPNQAARPLLIIQRSAMPKTFKKVTLDIEAKYLAACQSQNVLGMLEGTAQPDSFVMVCAHYDHLGRMGADTYFPGANDNASGTTLMMSLARHFAKQENRPKYSVIFCAFGSEEIGLLGSIHFVQNPMVPLQKIKFLLNFDILGTGIDGITTVNATVYKQQFDRLVGINDKKGLLKQVKSRGEACISDHCFFHRAGVPSFYTYTMGGISEYHNIYDKAETLTLEEFDDLLQLFAEFLGGM